MAQAKDTPAEEVKVAPEVTEAPIEPEKVSLSAEEEAEEMKRQVKYQATQLIKMAVKMGIDLNEIYEKPPAATTVVVAPATAQTPAAPVGKLPPGSVLGTGINASWVQWTRADLNPEDTIEFSPLPIPGVVYPFLDENGFQKIKLDVNGLVCWLTCGIPNVVNRYFWNVYNDTLIGWRQLEEFKRLGPSYAPWGKKGPDGGPAWSYTPVAATFGMDDKGHSLRIGRPTPLDQTMPEEIETPSAEPEK